ncbi:DNA-binding PadR family transcriptional regulator [Branchiibius hedensis]|uniref:DNA-binding transcriptional regulator, PadR family n=1 Tax=Branchiibius hedensis TaxID=672460 RepID=A0A2Y8ZTN2_9MICO|nr:PadR family transcriptional regulator [Branchiibius hedensis]PWJ26443.1 DNA-binding PadR family transcriptional regulator [Branchiibius hedensis]SSA35255.1 DNA-binding transcriptional regulator, PadR family [Branchiibius hedensis]
MSVRYGLLALLSEGPIHGSGLRAQFEAHTGGTWPLNVGQVFTTLARLERDGLVEQTGPADDEGKIEYALTDTGRAELETWWSSPVERATSPRDELAIKLVLAVTLPGIDVRRVVQTQRTASMAQLRDLTRLKRSSDKHSDIAWTLLLENHLFAAEAEVRWLDYVESTLTKGRVSARAAITSDAPAIQEVTQ